MRSMVRGIVLVSLAVACSAIAGEEKDIPLKEVPKKVLAAAQKAVPGIILEDEAEVEQTKDGAVYELEGAIGEKEYELHVSEKGKILKIEEEDEHEQSETSDSKRGHDEDDDDHHHEHKDDD